MSNEFREERKYTRVVKKVWGPDDTYTVIEVQVERFADGEEVEVTVRPANVVRLRSMPDRALLEPYVVNCYTLERTASGADRRFVEYFMPGAAAALHFYPGKEVILCNETLGRMRAEVTEVRESESGGGAYVVAAECVSPVTFDDEGKQVPR